MDDTFTASHEVVLILDFGSQYSHLIARRLRECKVYCELQPYDLSADQIRKLNPKGIVLSGGPQSVYATDGLHVAEGVFDLGIPILGICYGLQEMAWSLGGHVVPGVKKEYGHMDIHITARKHPLAQLFHGLPDTFSVWMSHGDKLAALPTGFVDVANTANTEHAAVSHPSRWFYGLQFHPEVTHTQHGTQILRNFVTNVCKCRCDWSMSDFVSEAKSAIKEMVGHRVVIGAVSGGVDSTVAAVLMKEAVGDQFHGFLVDNGVMRKNEAVEVMDRLANRCGVNLQLVDASEKFLDRLTGVSEPEKKRKIIGNTFIECFEKEASKLNADFLLQGTLYPDVIESISHKGPSATIKTHHNVGGLPDHMKLKLIEPLRFLFKDEVRALGLELGIERESIFRHPFPGPGLAIRILGDITTKRLKILQEADSIFLHELRVHNLYNEIGQAFAVLLPVKAVGVMGDKRTYEEVITLRAVKTSDYMTADWFDLPTPMLRKTSARIVNEVPGVNRVTYDITSKPPGTIEWE
ncbi:GMP synthase (glutamine-hydrolysing) [Chondrus crispus]|uniref:GMP synthase [glutamine-hydrolyzing] n=1 Tax=Chondrus crispus TaxID=2769 RepID=R7QG35_CHOCR|nr:GMP synthase (glutamine-hydrolysing) [Chondrus crispus]CDF37019.1 GMP synthase (glutamine-hydrolysing) [Chondrus crispus]|eukprot:XP_005716838.1 GMP synthase (glutamine-hydrolysing) [Chondrus crispus]